MASDEKLDARQRIAKQLDRFLGIDSRFEFGNSPSPATTAELKNQVGYSPDFSKADLSDAEIEKYITRKKRGQLADEIKRADDPLGYVRELKGSDRMDELPGGVTRPQAERLAKLTKARRAGEQAASLAQTPYERPKIEPKIAKPLPRESDRLTAVEMQTEGFGGLAELKRMQEDKGRARGFKGLGKATPLTTPGQKLRRAARMANRQGNTGRASQLAQQAAAIEPLPTSFFKSPEEREAAKAAQGAAMVELAKKKAEEAR